MEILWAAPLPDLENICRSPQFLWPEHGLRESVAFDAASGRTENGAMSDILMLAIGLCFFALLVLYGLASERL